MRADVGRRHRLIRSKPALDREIPFIGERDLQMRVDRIDIRSALTGHECKGRGLEDGVA